jgi:hypothetical protein
MLGDRRRERGDVPAAPQQPPSETDDQAADHGAECPSDGAAAADAAEQCAERVVVGEVFDEVDEPGGGCARDACE